MTRQNIAFFHRIYTLHTAVMTITFGEDLETREAQKRLGNFKRRVLKENFGASVTVREFTQRGRPHFHLVIDCKGDVTTGFNWGYHKEVTAWSKAGRKGAKPKGSLNRSPHLVALHQVLRKKGPLYGLGRIELVPVEKPEAIGFYLGGYLVKSLAHKPASAKGTRAVNYSYRCPRILSGAWSWANAAGWVWRAKLATWATRHGCETMKEVAALFGPKWAYHHREAILTTPLSHYPTAEHARIDGVEVPDGAVDIGPIVREWGNKTPPERSESGRAAPERQDSAEQDKVARSTCHPSATALQAAQARSGEGWARPPRVYELHSRPELEARLNWPCQNYQRPLRLPTDDRRTS
jgi:hypothetical protein